MNLRYDYDGAGGGAQSSTIALLDTFKGLAAVNSKNVEYSTRDGHVMGALVDITYTTLDLTTATVYGVPNSWKFMNAFRKFHIYRQNMFKEQGVTKSEIGRYSHTIRPALLSPTISVEELDVQRGNPKKFDSPDLARIDSGDVTGGDWDRTQVVSAITYSDDGSPLANSWGIHILGDHHTDGTPPVGTMDKYISVGMITAYNQDRQSVQVMTDDTSINEINNPLAALLTQDVTSAEISTLVSAQEEQLPPYDIGRAGDSAKPLALGDLRVTPFFDTGVPASVTLRDVFLPAGFAAIEMGKAGLSGTFDVKVKALVECRDWA